MRRLCDVEEKVFDADRVNEQISFRNRPLGTFLYLQPLLVQKVIKTVFFLFKRVLNQGPEWKESKLTVLCPLIIIILISYIIIYYIIIKLLIMENHPSQNRKQNFYKNRCCLCLGNRTGCIRPQCRKATVLSCHGCLISTGVEKQTTFKYRL